MQSVQVPDRPGWVRYCREGSLFDPGPTEGLGPTCLALKTLHMLGLLDRLDREERDAWTGRVQSFQTRSGDARGHFEDEAVLDSVDGLFRRDWETRRAETRQACATLMTVRSHPLLPLDFVPEDPSQTRARVREMDWETPWHAGSQTAHLMAFHRVNARYFGRADADEHVAAILDELEQRQDPDTGVWFTGDPSTQQKVNGAMKVIAGYELAGEAFPHPDRVIDFVLSATNDRDACHHADFVYALHKCARHTDHRRGEIEQSVEDRIPDMVAFRKPDGGFSFDREASGQNYYGHPTSTGEPVSDVHGTCLFTWGLVMAADLLGYRDKLGWKLPVT